MVTKVFALLAILLYARNSVAQPAVQVSHMKHKLIALVVGVGNYHPYRKLPNPPLDAMDVAHSLRRHAYRVSQLLDPTLRQLDSAVKSFFSYIPDAEKVVVYYSGHSIETNGVIYLFPADVDTSSPRRLYKTCYGVSTITRLMERQSNGENILILDGCRNNISRAEHDYFSRQYDEEDSFSLRKSYFFAYASSSNQSSLGSTSRRNSLFTEGMLHFIDEKLTLDELFSKVNAYVKQRSNGKQIPAKSSTLSSPGFLFPDSGTTSATDELDTAPAGSNFSSSAIPTFFGLACSGSCEDPYPGQKRGLMIAAFTTRARRDWMLYARRKAKKMQKLTKNH